MDPLSVTASIIAILQLTVKVSEGLKDLTDASTDRIQFETDIRYLSNLLVALLSRIDESSDDPWHVRARELGAKGGLIYQYRVALVLLRDKISAGHGIKKIGKALLWKYIKDDAERILLGMERLKSFVQMALGMDHFELSRAIESRVSSLQEDNNIIGEGVGAIQHDIDRQRHHLIMNWLSSADFPAQQADFLALVQADTGLWFLNSPEFNEWLQGPSKTLFCHGIPGAGKTMIAAIAVDYLHNNMESPDVGVAYLYCSYKRQADQNAPDLLAAILKQLVQDRPSIAQPLSSLYNSHKVRGTRLSLNECTDQDGTRSQLLKFCRDFGEQTDLRLMVTSRDIPDIADEFKRIPQLEVRASNADVRQYVGGKVKQLAKCVQRDGDLQELVQNKIVEAVDGMFLLAYLHLKSLVGKRTKANIISTLDNLSKGPEALNDAYSEAIVRIDSQPEDDRISAKNVLAWILYAQRPLTTTELCHALATRTTDKELDLDNIPDIKDLVSVCAGLVTIDEESQIVRLVHYTTQNYLVSIQEKWIHDIQYHIASTCLTYLCFNTFTTGSCTSDVEFESRLEQHEFLDYCAQYWGQHVAAVQERICGPAMVLLQNTELIASATQAHTIALKKSKWDRYSQDIPKNVTGLHLAVSFGLSYLCEQLLPSDQGEKLTLADARDSDGLTPLMWAARNGHEDAVMLLLRIAEVNPNARDNEGRTPLIWAALNGHENTVKQLLLSTNRVYPNVGDDGGWTPLVWAARNGHKDTVEQLLVDPNAKEKNGWTPLFLAVYQGFEGIVKLLLSTNKANLDEEDNGIPMLLKLAAAEGHEDIAELLKEKCSLRKA
ncbi:ankyrin [Bimuria novae-zelandiae CBS 107.79]|uniref:Ankyrin n=1 Tax=Bimuria novae-zelandiae CBS 107.79 TaxID=1447943 RepID=A0A6A5VEP1_9PLEO|nr:ankyrin [Bimuria novae-zelandiae CBS 107.79]